MIVDVSMSVAEATTQFILRFAVRTHHAASAFRRFSGPSHQLLTVWKWHRASVRPWSLDRIGPKGDLHGKGENDPERNKQSTEYKERVLQRSSRGRARPGRWLPAEEQLDLLEESVSGRLVLKEEMVLALQGNEPGARNAGCHLTPSFEGHPCISSHVHHERRCNHFAKKLSDIDFTRDL